MSAPAAAPPQRTGLDSWQQIDSVIQGTVTIIDTGGILGLSGGGSGWSAVGNVITFAPLDNTYYALSLEPPPGWTWSSFASLEIFRGDDNLCGFYSNDNTLMAFNGTDNQAPQTLTAIFNLENELGQPAPFTVVLAFPSGTEQPDEGKNPAQAMPIVTPNQQSIQCRAVQGDKLSVHVEGSGPGWSTSNPDQEGHINLQPVSNSQGTISTWNLGLDFEEPWQLAGTPSFEIYFENESACGVVFLGPRMKAYNFLPPGGAQQIFTLGLYLINTQLNTAQWVDDPTIVFDPLDPPT